MNNQCIVCDDNGKNYIYPGIIKCSKCDYVYADIHMSQNDFEHLYNSGYFNGEEYSNYLNDKTIIQKNFKLRLKTLLKYIDNVQHRKLLEVGAAYGFFLELVKDRFELVTGIDVTKEGVRHGRDILNLNMHKVDLLDWNFEGKKFDIVCMWDTIEHLKRPDLYLYKISENMTQGGLIAISTGDIESLVARFRKSKWRLIHPPTHAHYFSRKTLTQLLDRAGYDVIHFEYGGFFRSLDNIVYNILVLRMKINWLYKIMKKIYLSSLPLYLNLYDIMYIIAKKR